MSTLTYIPEPTPLAFHNDTSFIRAIAGPPGAGKSVACVMELLFIAMRQEPDNQKKRRTRMLIVRSTYPRLSTTTAKTIREWLPLELGSLKLTAPMTGFYAFPLPDGTRVEMELVLMALEDERDVDNLRSGEYTAVWVNEATENAPAIIRIASQRVGRFPSRKDGVGPTQKGVLVDFNLPDKSHWLHEMFEERVPFPPIELPDGTMYTPTVAFFKQPAAVFCDNFADADLGTEPPKLRLNPDAENLKNLESDYYANQIVTLNWAENKSFLQMRWSAFSRGKLVFGKDFSRTAHVGRIRTKPIRDTPVHIGIDTSGLHPAAVFGQLQAGTLVVMDECYGEDMAFEPFLRDVLLPLIAARYQGCELLALCDPSNPRDARTGVTPVQQLIGAHIHARPAVTNTFSLRREAVARMLGKRNGMVIDPACVKVVWGLEEGYVFKKLKGTSTNGGQLYGSEPDKQGEASHFMDALQYLCLPIARVSEEGLSSRSLPKVRARRVM